MDIAFHAVITGKPDFIMNKATNKRECFMKGTKTNLGYHWATMEDMSWDEVFDSITVNGLASTAALKSDHRCDANFVSRELIMVDIDYNMDLNDLFKDAFYDEYGAGFYTSPSHTDLAHRFRILFRLEKPITDAATMKRLHEALMIQYPYADSACKDASRIFFGTENCLYKEKRMNLLPEFIVLELLKTVPIKVKAVKTAMTKETSAEDVHIALNELKKHYGDLAYDDRRDVTWAVMDSLSPADTIVAMRNRWSDHDCNGKYESFTKAYKAGTLTMGTIIWMIRQKDPTYKVNATKQLINNVSNGELSVADALTKHYNEQKRSV